MNHSDNQFEQLNGRRSGASEDAGEVLSSRAHILAAADTDIDDAVIAVRQNSANERAAARVREIRLLERQELENPLQKSAEARVVNPEASKEVITKAINLAPATNNTVQAINDQTDTPVADDSQTELVRKAREAVDNEYPMAA